MSSKESLESKLGFKLPEDYVQFLNSSNKEKYNFKEYCVITKNGIRTDGFIDQITTYDTFWKHNKYRSILEEYRFEDDNYVQPEFLYIIADCHPQSICMAFQGKHKGKIYNCDYSGWGISFQAPNLKTFLNSLYISEKLRCNCNDLKKAVLENNLVQLQELMTERDGKIILKRSEKCELKLFELARKMNFIEIENFLKQFKIILEKPKKDPEYEIHSKVEIVNWENCYPSINKDQKFDGFWKNDKIKKFAGEDKWKQDGFFPKNGMIGEVIDKFKIEKYKGNIELQIIYILKINGENYVPYDAKGLRILKE